MAILILQISIGIVCENLRHAMLQHVYINISKITLILHVFKFITFNSFDYFIRRNDSIRYDAKITVDCNHF